MTKPGEDVNGIARTEADHHMKCPACGQWFDMRDLWQVAEYVHGDSEIEVIRPTDWLLNRDSGCKSDEQCRSLRPILKPACLIDMAKLPHLHDAASPLACSPASILDRAIWIIRACNDE